MKNNTEEPITICIPITLICSTSNDVELGEKVRQLYWESQNK
jgi:hypothetical protein